MNFSCQRFYWSSETESLQSKSSNKVLTTLHLYNRQRNLCVSLLQKKTERDYFKLLNNKIVFDSSKFWQTISPLFSEKVFCKETIALKANNRIITNNQELAETFNTFFSNTSQNLRIDSTLVEITQNFNTSDSVLKATKKYEKVSSK